MKRRVVIEVESESYLEKQFLIDKFPGADWVTTGGKTRFFINIDENDRVSEVITKWKEMEKSGYKEE
ncbi:MAG: hypothetical protein K9L62_10495 [Vallitaleaceae bacterium]|nr:hypothetical protein [Vallitaleaceae bacterium]